MSGPEQAWGFACTASAAARLHGLLHTMGAIRVTGLQAQRQGFCALQQETSLLEQNESLCMWTMDARFSTPESHTSPISATTSLRFPLSYRICKATNNWSVSTPVASTRASRTRKEEDNRATCKGEALATSHCGVIAHQLQPRGVTSLIPVSCGTGSSGAKYASLAIDQQTNA